MDNYSLVSTQFLRDLCIKNNWFTCGTCEQYEKLFELNRNGCTLDNLALVIWLCSDEKWDREHIYLTLCIEKRNFLNRCYGLSK